MAKEHDHSTEDGDNNDPPFATHTVGIEMIAELLWALGLVIKDARPTPHQENMAALKFTLNSILPDYILAHPTIEDGKIRITFQIKDLHIQHMASAPKTEALAHELRGRAATLNIVRGGKNV